MGTTPDETTTWAIYLITEREGVRAEMLMGWGLRLQDAVRRLVLLAGNTNGGQLLLREMPPTE